MRRRPLVLSWLFLIALAAWLTACVTKTQIAVTQVPGKSPSPTAVAGGATPGALPPRPLPPAPVLLGPTITPNIPAGLLPLVTAKPPAGFMPPQIDIAVLVFINATDSPLRVTVEGVPDLILLPPGGSAQRQLAPGNYSFTAVAQDTGQLVLSDVAELESRTRLEITITLGTVSPGDRAQVTIINGTGCELSIHLTGPEDLTVQVPAGEKKTLDVASGTYRYTAVACEASLAGEKELIGQSEWTFSSGP